MKRLYEQFLESNLEPLQNVLLKQIKPADYENHLQRELNFVRHILDYLSDNIENTSPQKPVLYWDLDGTLYTNVLEEIRPAAAFILQFVREKGYQNGIYSNSIKVVQIQNALRFSPPELENYIVQHLADGLETKVSYWLVNKIRKIKKKEPVSLKELVAKPLNKKMRFYEKKIYPISDLFSLQHIHYFAFKWSGQGIQNQARIGYVEKDQKMYQESKIDTFLKEHKTGILLDDLEETARLEKEHRGIWVGQYKPLD